MDQKHSEVERALTKAKLHLTMRKSSVFFSTICYSLIHVPSSKVPTAGTNGKTVYYNPEFFLELDDEERLFLVLHETLHCAYMHMFRIKELGYDHRKANIAADHVINLQLIEQGFKMPKGGLADPQYKGMSMEEVYKLLPDPPPQDAEGGGGAPWDDLMEGDDSGSPLAEEERNKVQQQIQESLVRAVTMSKAFNDAPGTIPGDIEIFLNKLLYPKLPWKTLLRRYFKAYSKTDYTWKKPNRRYMPAHYLPSLYGESLMEIAVAVDVSGSITDQQFQQHISDVASVIKSMMPPKTTLIQFDHQIQAVDDCYSLNDLMKVKFTGRGGTNIEPVMQKAQELNPQFLMVFTDGYFHPPSTHPKCNVLWLIHNNPNWKPPFGKAIHYNLEE